MTGGGVGDWQMDILVIARGSRGSPISKLGVPSTTLASPGYDKYLQLEYHLLNAAVPLRAVDNIADHIR